MNINEARKMFNNTLDVLKDNGFAIDENNKVFEDKIVCTISINGRFLNEYMGDSNWRYNDVVGDIIISEEQYNILMNKIIDEDDKTSDNEQLAIEAAKILSNIFDNYDTDDNFYRLYCIDNAEFNNVIKSQDSLKFSEENRNSWNIDFTISKKRLSDITKFEYSDEYFGCI